MNVLITTPDVKKYKLDSKVVDAEVIDEGYRIIVSPTDSQHILNHNRNLYPCRGSIIEIPPYFEYLCTEALVVGSRKKRYKLICYRKN